MPTGLAYWTNGLGEPTASVIFAEFEHRGEWFVVVRCLREATRDGHGLMVMKRDDVVIRN